jgi:DNA-binding transcriptional ArsR family regulator
MPGISHRKRPPGLIYHQRAWSNELWLRAAARTAEPNQFQIVELLLDGPRPVGDMVDQLGLRQPQVSKHLRVLSEAGLVGVRVDAQRRIYALRAEPLKALELWLEKTCGRKISIGWTPCSGG